MAVGFTPTAGPGGMAGIWMQNQAYKRWQEQNQANDEEGMQMELLQAEIDNIKSQGQGDAELSAQSGKMATEYLAKWNEGLDKAGGMFNTAITELGKSQEMVGGAYKDVSTSLGSMSEDISKEWSSMKEQWGGVQGELIGSAREDIENRGQLTRQFMDLTRGDEEGASGRAMADVAAQAEGGRKSEAMRLQSLGIDPASGRGRSMMRTSRNEEALGKVLAGNKARIAEKERVAGLTATGLNLIDPSKSVSAAAGIQAMQNNLLSARSNLETNRANILGNLAGTSGNIASRFADVGRGYATAIAGPRGEMGAAQLGTSQGARPTGGGTPTSGGIKPATSTSAAERALAMRKKVYG